MNNDAIETWTIGKVLTWSTQFLQSKGMEDSPRLDAELLLAHALRMKRIQLYMEFDKPLSIEEREPFKLSLKRRAAHEPVAYIIREKEFMGHRFEVGPEVLIPRPDTEILVEKALALAKARDAAAALRILDIGTGSGCIACSLAKDLPAAEIEAWDIDAGALALAERNAAALGTKVHFKKCDMLDSATWLGEEKFDLIVSNPPYICPSEKDDLAPSVRDYEPRMALFAPPDGLAFYRQIARSAPALLRSGGVLLLEIGATQAAAVTRLLRESGWVNITCQRDFAKLDRVLSAERPGEASR